MKNICDRPVDHEGWFAQEWSRQFFIQNPKSFQFLLMIKAI